MKVTYLPALHIMDICGDCFPGADHREAVPGDGEEELVGERRVDDAEHVGLAVLDGEPEGAVAGAREQVARLAVDGVRVRGLEVAAGAEGVGEQLPDVAVPPLPCR